MSETMKDSGVAWIGDIPKSWNIKRVKYLASLKGRIGWQGLTSDEYTDEGPYLITGVDFENGSINWNSCVHVSKERWEEAREIQVENGDLLITKDGTVGKVAIVSNLNDLASLNSGVLVIRTLPNFNRRFLFWVLQSEEFWVWFRLKNAGNSTIIHLYQNDFAEFSYTYPNSNDQTLIANFLDEQCGKINDIATNLEKQIDILQKYKKSLITETVTKGLDKSALMKDSGIEWIGKIPTHWEVKKIKYFAIRVGDGLHGTPEYSEGEYFFINGNNLGDKNIQYKDETQTVSKKEYLKHKINLSDNTVLISLNGTLGNVSYYNNEKVILGKSAGYIILNDSVCKYFVGYYLQSLAAEQEIVLSLSGTTIQNLSLFAINNLYLPFPNLEEQTLIANFLDQKCTQIDSIMESKKEQLSKLQQHKKSLIYEYVTGKKRVKGVTENGN